MTVEPWVKGMWERLAALLPSVGVAGAGDPLLPPPPAAVAAPASDTPVAPDPPHTTPGVKSFQHLFPLRVPKEVPPSTITLPQCLLHTEVRGGAGCVCGVWRW